MNKVKKNHCPICGNKFTKIVNILLPKDPLQWIWGCPHWDKRWHKRRMWILIDKDK